MQAGTYELCYGNQMSKVTDKVVTAALHFQKPDKEPEHLQVEDLLPTSLASDEVNSRLHNLQREVRFLSLRFTHMKTVQEDLNWSALAMVRKAEQSIPVFMFT